MNNTNLEELDYTFEIERSEKFIEVAQALGDCIKELPLNTLENDGLVKKIINQVLEAEQNAFKQGFKAAIEYAGIDDNEPVNLYH